MKTQKLQKVALPTERSFQAPLELQEEIGQGWPDRNFPYLCMDALIAEGIREFDCPTPSQWAQFAIAGSVVAELNGELLVPQNDALLQGRMDRILWETLWAALKEKGHKLDKNFVDCVLWAFIPLEHHSPPDKPYFKSRFRENWNGLEYPDTTWRSVGNLRLAKLRSGREALKNLPKPTAQSVRDCARHVPDLLEIAITRIRRTYVW